MSIAAESDDPRRRREPGPEEQDAEAADPASTLRTHASTTSQRQGEEGLPDPYSTVGPAAGAGMETPRGDSARYRLERIHARGGMGVVHAATDLHFDRQVALKRLRPELLGDSSARSRFVHEALLTGLLEHPGVVPVYDLGADAGGAPYYVMKLASGATLAERIATHHTRRGDREGERRLLGILITVCRTLAFAHDRGVVHRDLKPANVIVGDYAETIVLDWGLAKRIAGATATGDTNGTAAPASTVAEPLPIGPDSTLPGDILGTPAYMPPEQANGQTAEIGVRSDVFSLGAILFQILTGRPPASSLEAARRAAAAPRTINSAIPAALNAICLKAMAFAPADRYATAGELADELERHLADEPVRTYVDPWHVRLARWGRRHRTLVASLATSALVLAIVAVGGGFVYQAAAAERARELAARRAAVEQAAQTARDELYGGQLQNGAIHLQKGIELCNRDASLAAEQADLERLLAAVARIQKFHELRERAEVYAWEQQELDTIHLLQSALGQLHVFEHWDWWNHLTELRLAPDEQERLRQQTLRSLGLLISMRLLQAMLQYQGIADFAMSSNEAAREQFRLAEPVIEAAARFQHSPSLDFAAAFAGYHTAPTPGGPAVLYRLGVQLLPQVIDPQRLRGATDRYFVGFSLLFFHRFQGNGDPLLTIAATFLPVREPLALARAMLGAAAREQPDEYWIANADGWAVEAAGEHAAAVERFNRCLALRPREHRAYLQRAVQFVGLGRLAQGAPAATEHFRLALRDLAEARQLAPWDDRIYWLQSECLRAFPESAAAAWTADLEGARLLSPDPTLLPTPFHNSVRIQRLQVLLATVGGLGLDSPLAEPWELAALCYWRLGQGELAARGVERALERQPAARIAILVRGEQRLAAGDLDGADQDFLEVLRQDADEHLAHRGRGLVALQRGDAAAALPHFARCVALAQGDGNLAGNDSRLFESLILRAQAAARAGAVDQLLADAKRLLALRPSHDCQSLREALQALGDDESSAGLRTLDRLLAERSPAPTRPLPKSGASAPLLNGDFELSLTHYWETTPQRPTVWWNDGGCQALAERALGVTPHGQAALRILSRLPVPADGSGSLRQTFPLGVGGPCRLRCASRGERVEAGAFRVLLRKPGAADPLAELVLPDGDWEWRSSELTAELPAGLIEVEIRCTGRGALWLDNLELTLLESI